ncbi:MULTISPECIES: hypothetical protein [unclassified Robiginitalea]|uniref:hypothetical protein n=1 Tax=Robiginitalea TaxID=252306 RepID=UPI00234975DB|nr:MULTISPECIES: hypothetical protein [unclassified Robiginitalea]
MKYLRKENYEKIQEDLHPLGINFRKRGQFDFRKITNDEYVFYEWLVLCQWMYQKDGKYWCRSIRSASEDLGISSAKLRSIQKKFRKLGLVTKLGGLNNSTRYFVSRQFITAIADNYIFEKARMTYVERVTNFLEGKTFRNSPRKGLNRNITEEDKVIRGPKLMG